MALTQINLAVNGIERTLDLDGERTLLDVLRNDLGLNGPKYGCGWGQCGACSVLIDGAPARACVLRALRAVGRSITTLEGLADSASGTLHPVQQAFVDCQGAQCGYCLNGMVMTAISLLTANRDPSEDEVREAFRDNLCRCGTHREIIDAVLKAATLMAGKEGTSND